MQLKILLKKKNYKSLSGFHFKTCGSVVDANSTRYQIYERK